MKQSSGFSLIEILVALLLSTTTTFILLQHQWQSSKFFNQLLEQCRAHQIWKNAMESNSAEIP